MHTRSKGNRNVQPYTDNILKLQREQKKQRNRERAEQRNQLNMENQPAEHPVPVHHQRRVRTIGAGDAPNTHHNRSGIVPPAVQNNNFEIKSSTITMVQNQKFHGLPVENPLDHLDEFERLCGLTKVAGVSEDAFKLRLFPFSLGDKAHQWEKNLPPGSITTWDDCKKAFLAKFFSTSRTAKFRNQISSFVQSNAESFSEAWERFRSYQSQCPHHGLSDESLLSILYRGVLPKIRMLLDTASNGNFLNKNVEEGWELVENMAAADGNYGEDYDRHHRVPSEPEYVTKKEMKTLNEKLDRILLSQTRKPVHMVCSEDIHDEEEEARIEEICYMQNQGNYQRNQGNYNQNNYKQNQGNYNAYKPNPNLSYRSTNVANPQDQVYPPPGPQQQPYAPRAPYNNNYNNAATSPPGFQRPPLPSTSTQHPTATPDITTMLQQLLHGQTTTTQTLSKMQTDIQRLDASHMELSNKVDQINTRLQYVESQQASTSMTVSGHLPGKPVQNPKEYTAKSITLRSGRALPPPTGTAVTEDSDVQEGEDNLIQDDDGNKEPAPKTTPPITTSNQAGTSENQTQQTTTVVTRPSYQPQLPFPQRFKKDVMEKYKALFYKQISNISIKIPLLDAFTLIPPYQKFLKDAVKDKRREVESMMIEAHVEDPLLEMNMVKQKLDDPGTFTIPCSLGKATFNKCLCDLGASISLMPLSVATRLGYNKFKSCKVSLVLADRTMRSPHGLLENVPIRIGTVKIPTDFVVLDMDDDADGQLLLGRPFLASAGALIDVRGGTIELDLGTDSKVTFDINGSGDKPTIGGQTFWVNGDDAVDNKPPKRPKVIMKPCSKPNDFRGKTPMYEEVVDGKSLKALFVNEEFDYTETPLKQPTLDLGPDIILKPMGYVNGVMEYKVRGTSHFKPFAKIRQLLTITKPQPASEKPFTVKSISPCGAITLANEKGSITPRNGEKVKLHMVTHTERTCVPPTRPTI